MFVAWDMRFQEHARQTSDWAPVVIFLTERRGGHNSVVGMRELRS